MQETMMDLTNLENKTGSLADALVGADIFVGVSALILLHLKWFLQ